MKLNIHRVRVLVLGVTTALIMVMVPAANAGMKTESAVYNFTARTVQGKAFAGKALAGKPTVLWFWAPWCSICRGESSDLVALAKSFKKKINLVGVASLGPVKDMKAFITSTHTGNFAHIADVSGSVWNRFQVVSQPSFVFISKNGTAYREVGTLSKRDLFTLTRELIKRA